MNQQTAPQHYLLVTLISLDVKLLLLRREEGALFEVCWCISREISQVDHYKLYITENNLKEFLHH